MLFRSHNYFEQVWQKVRQTRGRLITSLRELGFIVFDSEANFILASPPNISASELYNQLKERQILVRYFKHPRIQNYVRISIGTDGEIDRLLSAIQEIMGTN